MEKKKRKISKLAFKLILGCIVLGILIGGISSFVGYKQYEAEIQKIYNDTAYQVAEVAHSYIDDNDLKEYVEVAKDVRSGAKTLEQTRAYMESEKYQTVVDSLTKLREKMGANDIYVVYLDHETLLNYENLQEGEDWRPLSYIFDSYIIPEYNFALGDMGKFNPEYIEDSYKITTTGERSSNYFISESEFGYNTSAMLPIMDESTGKCIASIGVEIPMTTIKAALRQYILYAGLITLAVVVGFIAIYIWYAYKTVIIPVDTIAEEVGGFIENNNTISEKLKHIKTRDEIQNLAENTLKMEMDINEYIKNITAITAEKERIGAELNVATHIQASMLPCIFPAFPDRDEFDVFATMNPAKEVGGDFYDFFMVDDTHIAIVMADVSGKGVPAALFMVIAKTLIKDHTSPDIDLGQIFSNVNELLCESNSGQMFVTAFEGVLDLVTGEFRFVNAGHETPFIAKKGDVFKPEKVKAGFVLAGMEGIRYKAGTFTLDPGDKIFQYTDGVTEATNKDNVLYGMERLEKVLAENSDKTPDKLLPEVKKDIDKFVGDAPQFDDITMLCLEYKKKAVEKKEE